VWIPGPLPNRLRLRAGTVGPGKSIHLGYGMGTVPLTLCAVATLIF